MTDNCKTTEREPQPMVSVRKLTTRDEIGETIGQLFGEAFGYLQQLGQAPSGMPFALYHSMDDEGIDLECGMPVAKAVPGTDRVRAGELPGGT